MMRYQRVSPDILPISNGRKQQNLRACKDDDADRIPNYTSSPFDSKPLRPRSGSASTTPDRPPFPHFPIPLGSDHHPDNQLASAASPLKLQPHHDATINGACSSASPAGNVLLQWGHNKRSRGSRAAAAAAEESASGSHSRQVIKIQRRSSPGAEKLAAAAAMPPPGASYTRGANLRACTSARDATSALLSRSVEERSVGHPRSEKRSPTSPPEKVAHKAAASSSALPNGGDNGMQHESSKLPSEQDGGNGGGGGGGAPEKVNLDHFEWPRIFISLSRKEKEDDFMAMKGTKLPQRPKKRPKNIDKALQYCFPGMWLSDLTRGRYEVREKKCVKKKRRGLKGMESMDSDSD